MRWQTGIFSKIIYVIPAALFIIICPFTSAYADYTEPETYSYDFLVAMADEAGVTPNQFVVNYVFMSQVLTGNTLTNQNGILVTEDVETNLGNINENEDFLPGTLLQNSRNLAGLRLTTTRRDSISLSWLALAVVV